MENISGIDYESPKYLKDVYSRKLNINPVLTLDESRNDREIKKLFMKYEMKRKIKKLLGRG